MRKSVLWSTCVAVCALDPGAHAIGADPDLEASHDHKASLAPAFAPTALLRIALGQGEMRYESVPGWCELPDARPLGNTHGGIVIDADGLVYYNTDTDRSIMVHRPDGSFVRSLAPDYPAMHSMQIRTETDADGHTEQFIYAAHLAGKRALKLTLDGDVIWSIPVPAESGKYDDNPRAYNPTSVAVAPNGTIFVADGYGRNWVHMYDAERNYVRSFGGPGTEPGQFKTCHGMIVDERTPEPTLLVCDRENRRIQRFTLDGEFIAVVATDLRRPCSLSTWGDYTAVAELEGRVTILDGEFKVAAHLGDNPDRAQWANNGVPPAQWAEGVFTAPHGVCFDPSGDLYVMDWNSTGRISKLRRLDDSR